MEGSSRQFNRQTDLSGRDVTVGAIHIEVRVEARRLDDSYLREKNKWGIKQSSYITEGNWRKSPRMAS